jgi:NADH:ubiquinone oxidoreductase subunit 6 (subunit J)
LSRPYNAGVTAWGIVFLIAGFVVNGLFYYAGVRRNLWYVLIWIVTCLYLAVVFPFLLNASFNATAIAILVYTTLIIVFWFVRIPTIGGD